MYKSLFLFLLASQALFAWDVIPRFYPGKLEGNLMTGLLKKEKVAINPGVFEHCDEWTTTAYDGYTCTLRDATATIHRLDGALEARFIFPRVIISYEKNNRTMYSRIYDFYGYGAGDDQTKSTTIRMLFGYSLPSPNAITGFIEEIKSGFRSEFSVKPAEFQRSR